VPEGTTQFAFQLVIDFSNGTAHISFSSFEQITNTPKDYFVVIDLSDSLSNPNTDEPQPNRLMIFD
jgi:hypothetical protein